MNRKELNGESMSAERKTLLALPTPLNPQSQQQLNPTHPGKCGKKLLLAFAI